MGKVQTGSDRYSSPFRTRTDGKAERLSVHFSSGGSVKDLTQVVLQPRTRVRFLLAESAKPMRRSSFVLYEDVVQVSKS